MNNVSDHVTSGTPLDRRRFLVVGGFSVAATAVLAACGGGGTKTRVSQAGLTTETTALPDRVLSDTVLLRTASSLERSAIAIYEKALGMGLLAGDAATFGKLFQERHRAAAAFFDAQTTALGGSQMSTENAAVTKNIVTPAFLAIDASSDKAGDLRNLLHSLENVITETYQSFVPLLSTPALRAAVMSVGGAGAKHSALWASIIGGVVAPSLLPVVAPTTTVKGAVEIVTVPVFQAPTAFASMGLVPTLLNGKKVDFDLLGSNSYAY
jgi:Ferritin-like domain